MPRKGRNFEIWDSTHERSIAGFWYAGNVTFVNIEVWLRQIAKFSYSSPESHGLQLFRWNETSASRGHSIAFDGSQLVPGEYVLCASDGSDLRIEMDQGTGRLRLPALAIFEQNGDDYRWRARARDGRCLLTGTEPEEGFDTWESLHASHIFLAYILQIQLMVDPEVDAKVGGPTRIDALNNVMVLRSDVHSYFDAYQISFNPDDDYRIITWTKSSAYLAGGRLDMSHIRDPRLLPSSQLLKDQMFQALMKYVKGGAEKVSWFDYEDAFDDGSGLATRQEMWQSEVGKQHFELLFADRLHNIVNRS